MSTQEPLLSPSSTASQDPQQENSSSGKSCSSSKEKSEVKGFNSFVGGCFTLNYVMGTGFLTLPWAFVQSGVVLSSIMMILFFFFADFTKDYVLEGMARAEALVCNNTLISDLNDEGETVREEESNNFSVTIEKEVRVDLPTTNDNNTTTTANVSRYSNGKDIHKKTETSETTTTTTTTNRIDYGRSYSPLSESVCDENNQPPIVLDTVNSSSSILVVKDRLFEVNELCKIFPMKNSAYYRIYNITISMYFYFAMWVHATVFPLALNEKISIINDDVDYYIFSSLFAMIVVPIACLEFREQVSIQVFLSLCRAVMVILMVTTLFPKSDDVTSPSDENFEPGFDGAVECDLFHFPGLAKTLPIITFSFMFHHSIPGLSHAISEKRQLGSIFRSTLFLCFICYSAIAITVGWYFGEEVEKSSNLNWIDYRGGTGKYVEESGEWVDVAWWAIAISGYVVCFPAIDVVSAFPLQAITLGNNMFKAYHGRSIGECQSHEKRKILLFRLLASIPPIIGSLFVRDLGFLTDLTGAIGFTIMFAFPSLIYVSSKSRLLEEGMAYETCYKGFGSSNLVAGFFFVLGIGLMIFYLVYEIVQ